MATKRESKPTAQSVTEFVLLRKTRSGMQGVFSHPNEAAARAVYAKCVSEDASNGCENGYSLVHRTVAGSDVTEKELSL